MKIYSYKNIRDPRIVVIGGGTGLSTMLRGLKKYTKNLTAIVTVADDGGGSGILRSELGMPPPGDIRNCLQALANTEPTMEALLGYRFAEGSLKGQSFGNLFLAALNGMYGSFEEAVLKMSEVLAITGRVLPVSNEDIKLIADFEDGTSIMGESSISQHKRKANLRIKRVRLSPESPAALPDSLAAIRQADMIVLGPGSLYTSIIPNLLIEGIVPAISQSEAIRVYVLNVMTEWGETEGYTASDHVGELLKHSGERLFDCCLANSLPPPGEVLARYKKQGSAPPELDAHRLGEMGIELIQAPIADFSGELVRHSSTGLAAQLLKIYTGKSPTKIYT